MNRVLIDTNAYAALMAGDARIADEIKRLLRAKGRPIPINDVWIAASCMEHGARLLTLDAHFSEIDGLLRWEA